MSYDVSIDIEVEPVGTHLFDPQTTATRVADRLQASLAVEEWLGNPKIRVAITEYTVCVACQLPHTRVGGTISRGGGGIFDD